MTIPEATVDFPKVNIEPTSFLDKDAPAPYAPFQAIKRIASDKKRWESLLNSTNRRLLNNPDSTYDVHTSCINNFYVLAMIFVGEERTKEIYPLLSNSFFFRRTLMHKGKSIKEVLLHNLFTGRLTLKLNKAFASEPTYKYCPEQHTVDFLSKTCEKAIKEFTGKIISFYAESPRVNPYDFNRKVIDSLEKEMRKNHNSISIDCTFIYHIMIISPDETAASSGTKIEVGDSPSRVHHCFILEQYYSEKENDVRTRLHQAWQNKSTLLEHYKNMDYGEEDEGCFDEQDLGSFFSNLRALYLCVDDNEDLNSIWKKALEYQYACFKVYSPTGPTAAFRPDDGIFTGQSVCYVTSRIRPLDAEDHLNALVEKYC